MRGDFDRPRDLVVFGEDWGRHPSSTQHLIKHLAADRKVIWVNSVGMRTPRVTLKDAGRIVEKLRNRFTPRRTDSNLPVPPNVTVIEPKCLPLHGNAIARAINARVLSRQIRGVMTALDINAPVLWLTVPTAECVVGTLDEYRVVYYCCDDYAALPGVDAATVSASEARLAAQADLILTSSEALESRFPTRNVVPLPHGVDLDLFTTNASSAPDLPADGPCAGFYGSLNDWLDQDLLAETAKRLPHWTFILIGKQETDVSQLTELANIRLMGPRPHHELPGYSQHWRASLLPFRDTPQIRACNPLKLREYLAAGRPIMATDFPALAPYQEAISVVRSAEDLAASLSALEAEDGEHKPDIRRRMVRAESWRARAGQVDHALQAL